jgi:hypothetical protein
MSFFKKENTEFLFAAVTEMKCNGSVIVIVLLLGKGIASNTTKLLGLPYSRLHTIQLSLLARVTVNLTFYSVTQTFGW